MRWLSKMRTNGKPTLYIGLVDNKEIFSISTFAKAIYLQDLREMEKYRNKQQGLPSYSFNTIDNAKLAAKNSLKGIPIVSNCKDPFGGLSDIIQKTEELLEKIRLKKMNKLINKNVDWNNYRLTFPKRYLKDSKLDFELHKIISDILINGKYCKILDVGGGPDLTTALHRLFNNDKIVINLLDPNCTINPILTVDNIRQTTWDNIERNVVPLHDPYDLIVLRGSINYLTLEQISLLEECLAVGGILIANSFAEPTEMDRICFNYDNTITGREICEPFMNGEQTIMRHSVSWNNEEKIVHDFYYHYPINVVRYLNFHNVNVLFYGENSVLYTLKK